MAGFAPSGRLDDDAPRSTSAHRGSIAARIMSPPTKYPVRISASYVTELRARVEAVGLVAVARAAGLARGSVWRQLAGGADRKPTPGTIEAIRRAVEKLDPQGGPMPPPLVAVRGRVHHAWIAFADEVASDELERVLADVIKRHGRRK